MTDPGWLLLDCPEWKYDHTPGAHDELEARCRPVIANVLSGTYDAVQEGCDSRPVHGFLFERLVPAGYEYYAGNYRGSTHPCLQGYVVGVEVDAEVGVHPTLVQAKMVELARNLRLSVSALDAVPPEQRLLHAVVVASRLFEEFLTIHPYADGNGHLARFLVWLLLVRFGYVPSQWMIHPRPGYVNYSDAISDARRGRRDALERLILEAIE